MALQAGATQGPCLGQPQPVPAPREMAGAQGWAAPVPMAVLCHAAMVVTTVQHPICSGSLPGTKAELTYPCLGWCSLSFLTAHPGSSLGLAQTAGDTARTAGLNRPKGISCTVKHHAQQ